jgi:hypothetical protein
MKIKNIEIMNNNITLSNINKWEFTPANKRLLFEIEIPNIDIILRFSCEITRVPSIVTRAVGNIRYRILDKNKEYSNRGDFKSIPSSNNKWPILAKFQMNKFLYGKYGRNREEAIHVKKGLLDDNIEIENLVERE